MRSGEHPDRIFDRLHNLGLIHVHPTAEDAHATIAVTATPGNAVTVAANAEATALNAQIRARRVAAGEVDDTRTVAGRDGLPIGTGDLIQTRRNNPDLRVTNRQTFIVQHVKEDGTVWAVESGSGHRRTEAVRLPAEYMAEHVHLAYASTAHGNQGITTTASHTLLTSALDAAGVCVGMTQGRESNLLHFVAENLDDARDQFTTALERNRADRGLTAATTAAREAVSGLAPSGPVAIVNAEKDRLRRIISQSERDASRWEQAATTLHDMNTRHDAELSVREQALHWAKELAQARPDLVAARDQIKHEQAELAAIEERHARERKETVTAVFSGELPRPGTPRADERATQARDRADAARRLLDHIETLPVIEAATFILTRRAEAERRAAEQEAERSSRRRRNIFAPRRDPRPNRSTPPLGL
jgi:hypothetical protein